MNHALCTYTEVLEKKHKKERVWPAVPSGTQREALAAAGVCVSMKPAEQSSLLAVEELMRLGGDCVFHLGLTAKAGMSSPEQPASLCCHVDNSPHTLGSPRRAVMRAGGVELVLLALLFWKAAMHSSYYNTYTPALCTYCKHASHERKPGWVSVLCSESSD